MPPLSLSQGATSWLCHTSFRPTFVHVCRHMLYTHVHIPHILTSTHNAHSATHTRMHLHILKLNMLCGHRQGSHPAQAFALSHCGCTAVAWPACGWEGGVHSAPRGRRRPTLAPLPMGTQVAAAASLSPRGSASRPGHHSRRTDFSRLHLSSECAPGPSSRGPRPWGACRSLVRRRPAPLPATQGVCPGLRGRIPLSPRSGRPRPDTGPVPGASPRGPSAWPTHPTPIKPLSFHFLIPVRNPKPVSLGRNKINVISIAIA